MKTQTWTVNKASRDCCCLLPQCHRTVRVTTFTFQFHTQFSPQRSTTTPPHHAGTTKWQLGVVSAGVICEAIPSIELKKHLVTYLKLLNKHWKHYLLFLLVQFVGWRVAIIIFIIQHSGFLLLLTILAMPSPSPLGGVQVQVCIMCSVQLCYSSGYSFPDVQDVEYSETCRMVTLLGIHLFTITISLI